MKKLTPMQERILIKTLIRKGEYLGNGSSRIVYKLNENLCVKVANTDGGVLQNEIEVETYAENPDFGFAKIFAYGKQVVIMEIVKAFDLDDIEDIKYTFWADDFEEIEANYNITYDQAKQIYNLVDFLNDTFGETQDNYQIGIDKNGNAVAYDYGYRTELHESSIGNIYFLDTFDGFLEKVYLMV